MPKDKVGNDLKVGDIVCVPCKINSITMFPKHNTMSIETINNLEPYENTRVLLTLNTEQVIKSDE